MDKYEDLGGGAPVPRVNLRGFAILVFISQVLAVIIVIMVAAWMGNYNYGYSWSDVEKVFGYHPVFMIVGLVVLYGHSILVYRIWRNSRKIYVKILHAALHGFALLFASLGLKAVFDSHNNRPDPIPNLYSLHSWMGIITVALFAGQWLAGFVTFLLPCCSMNIRAAVKPLHVYAGIGIFLMAVATSLIGITEKMFFTKEYDKLNGEGKLANFLGLLLITFAVVVLMIVGNSKYQRPPEEQTPSDSQ